MDGPRDQAAPDPAQDSLLNGAKPYHPVFCDFRILRAYISIIETNERLLFTEVDSWMTGINRDVEGKQVRRVMRYSGGHPAFREHCDGCGQRLPGSVDGLTGAAFRVSERRWI